MSIFTRVARTLSIQLAADQGRKPVVQELESRLLFSSYTIKEFASIDTSSTAPGAATKLVRDSAGNLYGDTNAGGAGGFGTVFEVSPSGTLTTIYTFDGTHGAEPLNLVLDSAGNLYGITQITTAGGSTGFGNVFELAAQTHTFSTLETFTDASTGENPHSLTIDSNGNLFGTTTAGGADYGTIFELSAGAHTFSTLYTFAYSDGVDAEGLTAADGNLYGTTYAGALNNDGTVFELSNETAPLTTLAVFDGTNGADPTSSPLVDSAGDVFGQTPAGGTAGVLYVIPKGQPITTLAVFTSAVGGPQGDLVSDSSGNLFGVSTSGGASSVGSVFEYTASTASLSDIADFSTTGGIYPALGLVADGSGSFYGTTAEGGAQNTGEVFKLTPGTSGGGGGGGGSTGTASLTPTIVKSALPLTTVDGTKVKGPVALTVTNSGAAKNTVKDTVTVFASTDGVIDSSSISLGSISKVLPIAAGATGKVTVQIKPQTLATGAYTLLAETTDASGATSISTAGPALTVAAPTIILAGSLGAVTPISVKPGKTVAFTLTVTNSGNTDSTGPATISVGLSIDGLVVAVPLTPVSKQSKVKAGGKPLVVKLHAKIPVDQTALNYLPIVTYTQGGNSFTVVGGTAFAVI